MENKILEKLKKLIRHERSARSIGNVEEAAAFAIKIQELLDQYNLSLNEIDIEETRSTVKGAYYAYNTAQFWQRAFLRDLGELHGCDIIFETKGATLIGSELDREIVGEMYGYFEPLGRHLCDCHVREWQKTPDYRRKRKKTFYTRRYKIAFCFGYQSALVERLEEQQKADMAASNNEVALIYIGNKLADARAWTAANLKTTMVKAKRQKMRSDAFYAGRDAGRSVALTTKTVNG
jgi:Protein of unknown function (DUF2786)